VLLRDACIRRRKPRVIGQIHVVTLLGRVLSWSLPRADATRAELLSPEGRLLSRACGLARAYPTDDCPPAGTVARHPGHSLPRQDKKQKRKAHAEPRGGRLLFRLHYLRACTSTPRRAPCPSRKPLYPLFSLLSQLDRVLARWTARSKFVCWPGLAPLAG